MENTELSSFTINEGYIPRFVHWIKKRVRTIVSIASVGLLLTALQTYKAFFSPNVADDINKTIIQTVQDYELLKSVEIPDTLRENREVQLLLEYQLEFDIYKLYLAVLDYSKIEVNDDNLKVSLYRGRYTASSAYEEESSKILEIISNISEYENNVLRNKYFANTVDMSTMYSILVYQKKVQASRKIVKDFVSSHGNIDNLNENERVQFIKYLEQDSSNEDFLMLIKLQTKFYKNFLITTNIRLKEILRDLEKNKLRN